MRYAILESIVFSGVSPNEIYVSYCSINQQFGSGPHKICQVGENTEDCLCGSQVCSGSKLFCSNIVSGFCQEAPDCSNFEGDVATSTTCFAEGELYCQIGQYPYDSNGKKHCLDYPLCIHKTLTIPNTEMCTCWADDASDSIVSCNEVNPFCWSKYRRCVPKSCTTKDELNSDRCLCGISVCDSNSVCVNGQCGSANDLFNNFVIQEDCSSHAYISSTDECKLASWSYETNRPGFPGNRNPFESQLEQSPFWLSESGGTCKLLFSPLSEELDSAGLVTTNSDVLYHKFISSGSCEDVDGWQNHNDL